MRYSQKTLGIFILAVFALTAGSVICLAYNQPTMMNDCGGHASESPACPFMSASIPTIANASFDKGVSLLAAAVLVLLAGTFLLAGNRREIFTYTRHRYGSGHLPASFLNPTLRLISRGVLHPRVFGI